MANLVFKNIEKIYPGEVKAVSDFNLEIKDEEFIIFNIIENKILPRNN